MRFILSIDLTRDDGRTLETKLRILDKFTARARCEVLDNLSSQSTLTVIGEEDALSRMEEQLIEAKFDYRK